MKNKYLDLFNAIEGHSDEFLDNNFEMLYHKKLLREDLLKVFSFAVPNKYAIKEIVKTMVSRTVWRRKHGKRTPSSYAIFFVIYFHFVCIF